MRLIAVASGKGGVGKTTLVSNLSAALAKLGERVIAIDGNLTTSNLGLHLGIPLYPITFQDVIEGKSRLEEALYYHDAGFHVLPADISMAKIMLPSAHEIVNVLYSITSADFVLIDCAAGLGKECLAAIDAADELITVTTPDLPAMTDALKLTKFAEKYETKNIGFVVNKTGSQKFDVSTRGVGEFLNVPFLTSIPFDNTMRKALALKMPLTTLQPNSKAAQPIIELAHLLTGRHYSQPGLWSRLMSVFEP